MRGGLRGITGEGNVREMGKREKVLGKGWAFRGITGLGKREHALQLFCRHLLLFSSSAFGIAGIREEAAGLQ